MEFWVSPGSLDAPLGSQAHQARSQVAQGNVTPQMELLGAGATRAAMQTAELIVSTVGEETKFRKVQW